VPPFIEVTVLSPGNPQRRGWRIRAPGPGLRVTARSRPGRPRDARSTGLCSPPNLWALPPVLSNRSRQMHLPAG